MRVLIEYYGLYTYVKFPLSHIVAEARAPVRSHRVRGLARSGSELARLLTIVFTVPFVYHVSLRIRKGNVINCMYLKFYF